MQADAKRKETLRRIITKLQMDNNQKNTFYEKLLAADETAYLDLVEQMPISRIAKDKMLEVMHI